MSISKNYWGLLPPTPTPRNQTHTQSRCQDSSSVRAVLVFPRRWLLPMKNDGFLLAEVTDSRTKRIHNNSKHNNNNSSGAARQRSQQTCGNQPWCSHDHMSESKQETCSGKGGQFPVTEKNTFVSFTKWSCPRRTTESWHRWETSTTSESWTSPVCPDVKTRKLTRKGSIISRVLTHPVHKHHPTFMLFNESFLFSPPLNIFLIHLSTSCSSRSWFAGQSVLTCSHAKVLETRSDGSSAGRRWGALSPQQK